MWEVSWGARKLGLATTFLALVFVGTKAHAETNYINQNISGFNLPGVSLPNGSDEVRAADGTTCRSAVGGNGAYLDVGVIGNPEMAANEASFSTYGRLVVPLGKTPRRVDCTRLYDLEIQRLEMELKLAQMGLAQGISPVMEATSTQDGSIPEVEAAWVEDGWTKDGLEEN